MSSLHLAHMLPCRKFYAMAKVENNNPTNKLFKVYCIWLLKTVLFCIKRLFFSEQILFIEPHVQMHLLTCTEWRLKSACAPAQYDQPAMSAWRNFASLAIINVPSEDSDQAAQMRSLIRIFAGHISNGTFLTLWLPSLAELSLIKPFFWLDFTMPLFLAKECAQYWLTA